MRRRILALCMACSLSILFTVEADEGPRVVLFTPEGTVKQVRQVRAVFSESMVPFGDPRGMIEPFEIQCPEKGKARWADQRNWVFDFDRDLPGGVTCEFRLKPDLRTLSGKEITGPRAFSFSTGGPAIEFSEPYKGNEVEEEQVFFLTLNAEPDEESVLRHVGFAVEGIQDRLGVRIIQGKDREAILKARPSRGERSDSRVILIQCKQRFPTETSISLIWGKGVAAKGGGVTDQDQVLRFTSREPFSVEFQCERENPKAGCMPILPMSLYFSADISKEQASAILLKGPGGKTWRPKLKEEEFAHWVQFPPPFPRGTKFTVELPPNLRDDDNRPLVNADKFPLSVRTDRYPPLAKFPARFGIVEANGYPMLPVTLRNLEPEVKARALKVGGPKGDRVQGRVAGKMLAVTPDKPELLQGALRKVAAASRESSMLKGEPGVRNFKVPKPSGAKAFEVVGIPLRAPGLYLVELESKILGAALLDKPQPMFVPTAVLVTNLSVHFKWGRESSLAWVTTLDKGEPVKDATVTVRDCSEEILWTGKTDANGIARIDAKLRAPSYTQACQTDFESHDYPQMEALRGLAGGLFIAAQTPTDMSFVHSSWDKGIEPWRFRLPHEPFNGPILAHTILDRPLFRAGETVHMKHILRQHTTRGFAGVAEDLRPQTVEISHYGSEQKYEFPLSWDAQGVAESTWTIPKDAKLGAYSVSLQRDAEQSKTKDDDIGRFSQWLSAGFRVEEFRIPLLRGSIQPPRQPLINAKEVTLDLGVQYLAGGGAAGLPVKLRSEVAPRRLPTFEEFDDFTFSNGAVREGLQPLGRDPELEEYGEEEGEEEEGEEEAGESAPSTRTASEGERLKLPTKELILDGSGFFRTTIFNLPKVEAPRELTAEMEFRDPNGEVQTVSTRIPLWGSKYVIGIKPDSWAASKEGLKSRVAVLDLSGKPVPDVAVRVDLFEKKTLSHRKRLVGGFYAYEHAVRIQRLETLCEGRTDARGLLLCEARSPISGNVVLQAQASDEAGSATAAYREIWVAEKSRWWFEVANDDRMDLLPERKRYEPGEMATFQVRMPFKEATALITVEREGVMDTWVKPLSGEKPVIEVPIWGNYAPNVFVSVLVVRGRVSNVKPTALVDLGRPAFKLGIAEIYVGWRDRELKVNVTADRKVYKVRQKAQVRIRARTLDDKPPPEGSEVAVAAVDEGLLELMGNKSWDILPAMMGRRGYEVRTATAQMQVIGKRHYGLKALPTGGGGGRHVTREMFDTLLLWKARVPLDANGEASVEVPLNDALTSFRIVAVATGGTDLFGTGATSIQSTQDLMVFSGLPPLVREGDRFRAGLTVRNTSQRDMEVTVSAKAESISDVGAPVIVSLGPGQAQEVGWDVLVPMGIASIPWEMTVVEKGAAEGDRIKVAQKVIPAVPVRIFQASMAQMEKDWSSPVERPADALPGAGGIRVNCRPKVAEGLSGVADYMSDYPYTCMEQKVSVAVALRDEKRWKSAMADLPSYLDSDGLVKYFPPMTDGSPVLTAYIVAIGHEAGWEIPMDPRDRMTTGMRKFVEGSIVRYSRLPTADLSIRKLAALEALSRLGKAEPRLLGSISLEPNLWPTSAVIDWTNILLNMEDIPQREARLKEAEQILRSRLHFQGTTMGFSTERTDGLWWLMVSTDVNAVRTILTMLRLKAEPEDMARLVQGALARQRKGRWDLTLANAWGILGMEKFSRVHEAVAVTGVTRATLPGQSATIDWSASPKGETHLFPWPPGRESLALSHEGTGKPWIVYQSLAAIPLKEPVSSGFKIRKTIRPVQRKNPDSWSRGDVLRVTLDLEAQADQTWVAVSDPIPAGATILGTGLGRDSRILSAGEGLKENGVIPSFQERSFDAFRAYHEYVPKGNWALEYTLRLNQEGVLQVPPTRAEALYAPEMFGEIPNQTIEVGP